MESKEELEMLRVEITRQEKENDSLKGTINDLKSEIRQTDSQTLKNMGNEIASLKGQVTALEESRNDAENDAKEARMTQFSCKTELDRLKEMNSILIEGSKAIEVKLPSSSTPKAEQLSKFKNSMRHSDSMTEDSDTNLCDFNNSSHGESMLTVDEWYHNGEEKGIDQAPSTNHGNTHRTTPIINNSQARKQMSQTQSMITIDEWNLTDKEKSNEILCLSGKTSASLCLPAFLYGTFACKNSDCRNLHYIMGLGKLRRGICFQDFLNKGSCNRKEKCYFHHSTPDELRKDPLLIDTVKEICQSLQDSKVKPSRKKPTNGWTGGFTAPLHAENMKDSNGSHEKLEGKYNNWKTYVSAVEMQHSDSLQDGNVYMKVKNLCYKEIIEEGSCERKESCRFSHKILTRIRNNVKIVEELKRKLTTEQKSRSLNQIIDKDEQLDDVGKRNAEQTMAKFFTDMADHDTKQSFLFLVRSMLKEQVVEQMSQRNQQML